MSIRIGTFSILLQDVVPAIVGHGNPDSDFIIRNLRLPRAITTVFVGGAFGFSGAIFQSLARNPLASPDVIGITSGAAAAAVFTIIVIGGSYTTVALGALVGGFVTAAVVCLLAYKRGVSAYRLVLTGIAIGSAFSALTSFVMTRADIYAAQAATIWLIGSLNGRGWEHVRAVGLALLVLLPAILALARPLRALQLGDDTAKGLGSRCRALPRRPDRVGCRSRRGGHRGRRADRVRRVHRPADRPASGASPLALLPSALGGALLLRLADLVGHQAFGSIELPVVTSLIGAPYLVWLLARANKVGSGG